MFVIVSNHFIWIKKYLGSSFEMNTVLNKVDMLFFIVPFKNDIVYIEVKILIHAVTSDIILP